MMRSLLCMPAERMDANSFWTCPLKPVFISASLKLTTPLPAGWSRGGHKFPAVAENTVPRGQCRSQHHPRNSEVSARNGFSY